MAKKRKGRLIPIKKSVIDPRLGTVERTYYINPDKRVTKPRVSKGVSELENKLTKQRDNVDKIAEKMFYCNW